MSSQFDLEIWRQEIREIDEKILHLLSERMSFAQKIGDYKEQKNLPIKDFQIEKQIIDRSRQKALQIGLDPNLAEDLMTTIIHYSVLRQDEIKRKRIDVPVGQGQKALILGGSGQMGQWFAQFYESLGFSVSIYDLNQPDSSQYPYIENLANELNHFDILLLATPMTATAILLEELILMQPKGLIIDICSLKSPVLAAIQKATQAGLKIASMHPMFGPDTEILAGKNIIFCTGAGLDTEARLLHHFQQTSAHLITVPLAEHDRHMSYVLGAAHFINLIYANVLAQSGSSLELFMALGGTTFLQQKRVTAKVVTENQNLYFDIQVLNQATPELIQQFKSALTQYAEAITEKSRHNFRSLMSVSQEFFREK